MIYREFSGVVLVSGHGSEGGSDQDAENRIGNPERADPFFINCVEQGAGRDQQQD